MNHHERLNSNQKKKVSHASLSAKQKNLQLQKRDPALATLLDNIITRTRMLEQTLHLHQKIKGRKNQERSGKEAVVVLGLELVSELRITKFTYTPSKLPSNILETKYNIVA